jgi:hypothetical protein
MCKNSGKNIDGNTNGELIKILTESRNGYACCDELTVYNIDLKLIYEFVQ